MGEIGEMGVGSGGWVGEGRCRCGVRVDMEEGWARWARVASGFVRFRRVQVGACACPFVVQRCTPCVYPLLYPHPLYSMP